MLVRRMGGDIMSAINGEVIPAMSGWQVVGLAAATYAIIAIVKLLHRRA